MSSSSEASVEAPVEAPVMVEAIGVCKTYQSGTLRVEALRGVDLQVRLGEIVAIMGPSGCGKTTLLNCLSGLDSVTAGSITIGGRVLQHLSERALTAFRAHSMGFIFQTYNLLPVLTAVENVELPLLVRGVRPRTARQRALQSLDRVGIVAWAKHRPAEMSGGQQQRVAIARALATQPAIVWADEPTGALDSSTSEEILALMLELNHTQGLTFVWVTHAADVARYAQRLITMQDGTITSDRPVETSAANGPYGSSTSDVPSSVRRPDHA